MMRFIARNTRFIVPAPFVVLAAMTFWSAHETGRFAIYLASLALSFLAVLFYFGQLKSDRKRDEKNI